MKSNNYFPFFFSGSKDQYPYGLPFKVKVQFYLGEFLGKCSAGHAGAVKVGVDAMVTPKTKGGN